MGWNWWHPMRYKHSNGSGDSGRDGVVPPLHLFDALKWPCITLEGATYVATQYSQRVHHTIKGIQLQPSIYRSKPNTNTAGATHRIRVEYLSPDFTPTHPLAFLMQHIFWYHDSEQFDTTLYSLGGGGYTNNNSNSNNSTKVQNIRNSVPSTNYIQLAPIPIPPPLPNTYPTTTNRYSSIFVDTRVLPPLWKYSPTVWYKFKYITWDLRGR